MAVLEVVAEGAPVEEEEGGGEVEMSQMLQINSIPEQVAHLVLMLQLCQIQVSMTEMVL